MPQRSLSRLLQHLETRPASAQIFLHGEEEFLKEEAVQQILASVLDPSTSDFNFDQLRGSEVTPEQLASILATPPMMAEYRVVVVREAQGLSPRAREAVEEALQRGAPGIVLLLVASIPDRSRAKFYDTLKRDAHAIECPAVDLLDLPGWIVERAESVHGVTVPLEGARALAAAIGSQLGVLITELDKVVSYIGERREVTLEDIAAVAGYIPRVDRWAWFDCIGERRFAEALEDLPELLEAGETGVGLVIGMGTHLLNLGLLVAGGREALAQALRPNQRWLANRLQPQARRWSLELIDESLRELLRTDRLLKSASLTDRQALEELLLRLSFLESPSAAGRGTRRIARQA